ncbi:MAG: hypothetical protein WCP21_03470 [Armatimonadota bacterium]
MVTEDEAFRVEALRLRSEVAIRRGALADAVAQARRAIEADAENGRAHEQLGRALLVQGDWQGALAPMIEALHTGQAGSLAAGVAALGALETGDLATARGLFLVERYGDGLACAVSHTAQAWLLQAEGETAQAAERAASAVEELRELPPWAAQPEVLARLSAALRTVLRVGVDGEDEALRTEAQRQLDRVGDLLGGDAPPTPAL